MSAREELKEVYFIYSSHRLLLSGALERLIKMISAQDCGEMDVSRFTAGECVAGDIIGACQAMSFFGSKRLVIVREPLLLTADAQKEILDYTKNPNPETILVFAQTVSDKRQRATLSKGAIFKFCEKYENAVVHEYQVKNSISGWIKSGFAARKKDVSPEAVNYLLTWVGADLDRLTAEIDKLCAAAGSGIEKIDIEQCRNVVLATSEAQIFDLIGAIMDKDPGRALTLIEPLTEKKGAGQNLFALIERQFRLILKTKTKSVKGKKLSVALGVSSGQAYYLEKQSRQFSISGAKKALGLIVEADTARKSSPLPERLLLERLAIDLCSLS